MSTKALTVAGEKPFRQINSASSEIRVLVKRPGFGSRGQRIPLLTNHFQVGVNNPKHDFYHYSIAMQYGDGTPVAGKDMGRKVLDKVKEVYLANKEFAYDGEKNLYTVGQLPHKRLDFMVVLDDISMSTSGGSEQEERAGDRKRLKRSFRSKKIKVQLSFAAIIPIQAIANALRGQESHHFQDAVRILDIILRQNAAKKGRCLLVRQSFFHNKPGSFIELGGGVLGCRGFHSSFRATQGGLSLNMDVSTTMILKPGPVVKFLLENQNVRTPCQIDWNKAKRMLKNLKIVTYASKKEYKITGLSDKPCREERFFLKPKKGESGDGVEITVYEYFAQYKQMRLRNSAGFPCINIGKPKKPCYIPLELCDLVSLQRYTKSLSNFQRASLVEKSRQKPQERISTLRDALRDSKYEADMMLRSAGISIGTELMQVEGRVLSPPKLRVGNGAVITPRNGRWNYNNKTLVAPVKLERWAVVNFSARCDIRFLVDTTLKCGDMIGISIKPPFHVFEESIQNRRQSAAVRVEKMFEYIKNKLPGPPQLLLCILPERKNSELYGPWKRKNLSDIGIATQCIAPTKVTDQYITNVLLKINAKLDGMNSLLTVEHSPSLSLVSKSPTLILGMDVSHGSAGQSTTPSIAAVVSSRDWPSISRYRAAVRTQSPKTEMIANLFMPVSDTEDHGIVKELLQDFYNTSNHRKPEQIIIFRDGVGESEFNQVLNMELDQIIKACKFLDESWSPKFMVIIAQKRHHTKFFRAGSSDNVPPGTIVDNKVCDPKNNDFYLCSHAGVLGTSRPTHYQVLYDELGFSADDLQELVHSLSYVYQRSTTAVSLVAPICYAHLAAAQMSQFIKFDEMSETGSSRGGVTVAGAVPVQQLPRLHEKNPNQDVHSSNAGGYASLGDLCSQILYLFTKNLFARTCHLAITSSVTYFLLDFSEASSSNGVTALKTRFLSSRDSFVGSCNGFSVCTRSNLMLTAMVLSYPIPSPVSV